MELKVKKMMFLRKPGVAPPLLIQPNIFFNLVLNVKFRSYAKGNKMKKW